ncbi:MAG: hypothetical protein KUG77_25650 [Nannocystaceae bacterium]|nr:hypothetical protein [Nannocystaceae bacterium]
MQKPKDASPDLEFRADGSLPPYVGGSPDEITSHQGSPFVLTTVDACKLLGTSAHRQSLLRGLLKYRAALRDVGVRRGFTLIGGSMTENRGAEPGDVDVAVLVHVPEDLRATLVSGRKRERFEQLRNANITKAEFGVDAYVFAAEDILSDLPTLLRMFNLYSHSKLQTWKGVVAVDMRSNDTPAYTWLDGPARLLPGDVGEEKEGAQGARPQLIAYETANLAPFAIVPGRPNADAPWSRCLPMSIAESWGWDVTLHESFEARWSGGAAPGDLRVRGNDRILDYVVSHFGHGIISVRFPFLMRTPRGWNLQVRGPVNESRADAFALEGVVETDWSVAPFTFNWKVREPNTTVRFDVGDVIGRIVPLQRQRLEAFEPVVYPLKFDRGTNRRVNAWNEARAAGEHAGSQSEYRAGTIGSSRAVDHQDSLRVHPFRRVKIPHVVDSQS